MVGRIFLSAFSVSMIWLCASTLSAATIDGVQVPEVLAPEGERPALLLNGAAKRQFLFMIDVYVGSLYVEKPQSDPQRLFEDDGYKRMVFKLLRSVRGRRIAKAFYEGLQLNVPTEEANSMKKEIKMMVEMFDHKLKVGDTAIVEYIPDKGMHINLGGDDKGYIPSKKLFDAVLSIWIGEYPISSDFKAGILGLDNELRRSYE